MINSFYVTIAKWVGGALALLAVWFSIKQSGRNAERVDNVNKTLDRVKQRDKIKKSLADNDIAERQRLRERWTRK